MTDNATSHLALGVYVEAILHPRAPALHVAGSSLADDGVGAGPGVDLTSRADAGGTGFASPSTGVVEG